MSAQRPDRNNLRASDADREAAAGRLRQAAIEGRLTTTELEERLNSTFDSRWQSELRAIVSDVTPPAPVARPSERAHPPQFARAEGSVNILAVIALIASLTWWWGMGSAIAIVLGITSLITTNSSRQRGRGMATAAIVIGFVGLLGGIATVLFRIVFGH